MAVRALSALIATATVGALFGAPPAASAASLRCAAGVVGLGDEPQRVLAACGEPWHRTLRQRRVDAGAGLGPAARLIDVAVWTYRRGSGRFLMLLTFEAGRLVMIERGPRE